MKLFKTLACAAHNSKYCYLLPVDRAFVSRLDGVEELRVEATDQPVLPILWERKTLCRNHWRRHIPESRSHRLGDFLRHPVTEKIYWIFNPLLKQRFRILRELLIFYIWNIPIFFIGVYFLCQDLFFILPICHSYTLTPFFWLNSTWFSLIVLCSLQGGRLLELRNYWQRWRLINNYTHWLVRHAYITIRSEGS